jgi:hypothetical protein
VVWREEIRKEPPDLCRAGQRTSAAGAKGEGRSAQGKRVYPIDKLLSMRKRVYFFT